jgi:hypothetical protein
MAMRVNTNSEAGSAMRAERMYLKATIVGISLTAFTALVAEHVYGSLTAATIRGDAVTVAGAKSAPAADTRVHRPISESSLVTPAPATLSTPMRSPLHD